MSLYTSLYEGVQSAILGALAEVYTAVPGVVQSYDAATQRASVQPIVRKAEVNESDERIAKLLPVCGNVPVIWPGGGGGLLTFPLAAGDTVLLIFASCSLDTWLSSGASDVDPRDDRRHHPSDAMAIPILSAKARKGVPSNAVALDSGDKELHLATPDASDPAARKTDLDRIAACLIDPTVLAGIASAPVDGGTSYSTAVTTYFTAHPLSGSSKVKLP